MAITKLERNGVTYFVTPLGATSAQFFQLAGPLGPGILAESNSAMSVRSLGGVLGNLRVAEPVTGNDVATKSYVEANAGGGGATLIEQDFDLATLVAAGPVNSATFNIGSALPSTAYVFAVEVEVVAAFAGTPIGPIDTGAYVQSTVDSMGSLLTGVSLTTPGSFSPGQTIGEALNPYITRGGQQLTLQVDLGPGGSFSDLTAGELIVRVLYATGNAGSGGGGAGLIYSQENPDPGPNVYTTDWALQAAIEACGGACTVFVDTTYVGVATWSVNRSVLGSTWVLYPLSGGYPGVYSIDGIDPATGDASQGQLLYPGVVDGLQWILEGSAGAAVVVGSDSPDSPYQGNFYARNNAMFYGTSNGSGQVLGLAVSFAYGPSAGNPATMNIFVDNCSTPFVNDAYYNSAEVYQEYVTTNLFIRNCGPGASIESTWQVQTNDPFTVFFDASIQASKCGQSFSPLTLTPLDSLSAGFQRTLYVDLAIGGSQPVGTGTLTSPFNLIQSALNALNPSDGINHIVISGGYSNENLVYPNTNPDNILIEGQGLSETFVGPTTGPALSWVVTGNSSFGSPPNSATFRGITFYSNDANSSAVVFDGSWSPGNALGGLCMENCTVQNNSGSTTVPALVGSYASLQFYGDDPNMQIDAQQVNPVVEWSQGQFQISGQATCGGVKLTGDVTLPVTGGLPVLMVGGPNAQVQSADLHGTVVCFIAPGGQLSTLNAPSGQLTAGPIAALGITIAPLIVVAGFLGNPLDPLSNGGAEAPSIISFPDVTGLTLEFGNQFVVVPGGLVTVDLTLSSATPAGTYCDLRGAHVHGSSFITTDTKTLTLQDNITCDLTGAVYVPSRLTITGSNSHFVFGGTSNGFVFQPGGVASGNVYTSEAALATATQTLGGAAYRLTFDFSLVGGTYTPTTVGAWNLAPNGAWDGGGNGYVLSFANGTTLPYPPVDISGALTWQSMQAVDVCSPTSAQRGVTTFRDSCIALCYDAGALINSQSPGYNVSFSDAAYAARAGGSGFVFNASGGFLNIYANDFSYFGPGAVEQTGSGTASIYSGSASAVIDSSLYPFVVVQGLFVDIAGGAATTIPAVGDAAGALLYSSGVMYVSDGSSWNPTLQPAPGVVSTIYGPDTLAAPVSWTFVPGTAVTLAIGSDDQTLDFTFSATAIASAPGAVVSSRVEYFESGSWYPLVNSGIKANKTTQAPTTANGYVDLSFHWTQPGSIPGGSSQFRVTVQASAGNLTFDSTQGAIAHVYAKSVPA